MEYKHANPKIIDVSKIPKGFKIELGKILNSVDLNLKDKAFVRWDIYELVTQYFELS